MNKTLKHVLWTMFIFAALSIVGAQWTMDRNIKDKMEKQNRIYAEILEYNESLKNTLEIATTDEFVYQQSRNRLLMIKENEIIVIDSNDSSNSFFSREIKPEAAVDISKVP